MMDNVDHDDREGLEPEIAQEAPAEDAGDPAAAFEALRRTIETQGAQISAEMTIIRKGVEAAFERQEQYQQPADYSADLGQIVKQLGHVGERLQGVEQSPVLRQGTEHYARALERSGEGLVQNAARALEKQAGDLERAGRNLSAYVDSARERVRQDWWLAGFGIGGIVIGIAFTLFLPSLLPFSVAPRVASIVMADTPWQAGLGLMDFSNPENFKLVQDAERLYRANEAAIVACRNAAVAAGEEQNCTVRVVAPAQ